MQKVKNIEGHYNFGTFAPLKQTTFEKQPLQKGDKRAAREDSKVAYTVHQFEAQGRLRTSNPQDGC